MGLEKTKEIDKKEIILLGLQGKGLIEQTMTDDAMTAFSL